MNQSAVLIIQTVFRRLLMEWSIGKSGHHKRIGTLSFCLHNKVIPQDLPEKEQSGNSPIFSRRISSQVLEKPD